MHMHHEHNIIMLYHVIYTHDLLLFIPLVSCTTWAVTCKIPILHLPNLWLTRRSEITFPGVLITVVEEHDWLCGGGGGG